VSARRTLVIGGAGFIGSALTGLLAKTEPVRVLDDLSTGKRSNLEQVGDVELIVGSILDPEILDAALREIGTVYHLACLGVRHSIHSPDHNHEVNAHGTLRVLEAARRRDVDRVVYTSSSEVYGTATSIPMDESHTTLPHTVYGASKLAGESYVRAYHLTYGMATVVLRPFNAFGPCSHFEGDSGEVIPRFLVRAMNGLPPVVFGDGSQSRDFTYVEDTARAIIAAGTDGSVVGATLNVATGTEITIADLAMLVLKLTNREDLGIVFSESRPGDVHRLIGDSRRITRRLSWKPTTGLEEGLARLIEWHEAVGTDWRRALSEQSELNWESSP
jgi:UDP-glucose 4-epimerase